MALLYKIYFKINLFFLKKSENLVKGTEWSNDFTDSTFFNQIAINDYFKITGWEETKSIIS